MIKVIIVILLLILLNGYLIIPIGKYVLIHYSLSLSIMYFQISGVAILSASKLLFFVGDKYVH